MTPARTIFVWILGTVLGYASGSHGWAAFASGFAVVLMWLLVSLWARRADSEVDA